MLRMIKLVAVFCAALLLYLPFNSQIPITDPVESNYALTAREMLISQDWISPRIYGAYWFDKPVMIYWLIALSFKIWGVTEFAARFPSAVLSALSVVYIYWFVRRIFLNPRVALLSAAVLATSLEYWILARMIITDAALFLFSSVSLAAFFLGIKEKQNVHYILAYACAALAVLTKGPIGIAMPGMIIFAYILVTRQWFLFKRLFILPGLAIFFGIAGPWYFAMYQLHGREFIDTFLGLHNYLRATVSEHPADNVFYYYLVLFPLSLLPWTGMLFRSLALASYRPSINSALSYAWVWMLATIGFYTLMATKYPTYVFPASFPAAVLIGCYLARVVQTRERKIWLWLSVPAILLFLIFSLAVSWFLPSSPEAALIHALVLLAVITLLWVQWKGDVRRMPWMIVLFTAVISLAVIHGGLTSIALTRSAKEVAQALPARQAVVASYGDYMTSAVFYSGYTIPRLIEETEEQKPSSVWAEKHTMPSETVLHFDERTVDNPEAFVIVKARQREFENLSIGKNFIPVMSIYDITVYQRNIKKP